MPTTTAGKTHLAQALAGESVTPFNNANAHIGVGNGTSAFSESQTDLQGTSKVRKSQDTGYPQRSGSQVTYRSTFGASEANFAWEEWGLFNASTGGTMLNRRVVNMGTKNGGTWQLTVTITF